MGRPKLYKTPEERVLAARSYRAKYYAGHKEEINTKIQAKCIGLKGKLAVKLAKPTMTLMGEPTGPSVLLRCVLFLGLGALVGSPIHPNPDWTEIEVDLKSIIGRSSYHLVESLCQEYMHSGDYSNISDVVSQMEGLDDRLHTLVYRADDGKATDLSNNICSITRALEDLLLNTMEHIDITGIWKCRKLLYQDARDIVCI
ncbi:hypothetical protein BDN67DRAFT_985014 [Paxillus ammoniavirescens]|nr:hypothetical protein BDN67DRAFT_985014 [Paxillus ammoniavirescens]